MRFKTKRQTESILYTLKLELCREIYNLGRMPKAIFGGGVIGLLTNQDNRDQVGGYRLLAMTADLEDESQGNQEKQHKGQTK